MKTIKFLAPILSALCLLPLAAPRAAAADVPFHVDGTFTFTFVRGTTIEVSGDGLARPGGNFIFLDTVQLEYGGKVVEGMITLTFTSGSTLTFCYEAPLVDRVVEGPFVVVDGTGVFEGVTGSGVIWYPVGQGAPFTMDGTLIW